MGFKMFLTESNYRDVLIQIFNKAIRDELSASSTYRVIANQLNGPDTDEIKEHLLEHADEEYKHFSEFIDYASKHNFLHEINVELDNTVFGINGNNYDLVRFTQDLETKAAEDYKKAIKISYDNQDVETCQFFKEKLTDELKHFDENAYFLNQHREIT